MSETMTARHFAIVQAIARHALYALAALPEDHPQRRPLRWQVQRLEDQLREEGDIDRANKIGRLGKWFDDGAVVSTDMVILSEASEQTRDHPISELMSEIAQGQDEHEIGHPVSRESR